jgi:hypothetical protein
MGDADTIDPDAPDTPDVDVDTDTISPDTPVDTPVDEGTGDVPVDTEDDDDSCVEDSECLDDNPCTDDYCHESFHLCVNQPLEGYDCSPADICDGVGTCNELGDCVLDSSPLCDDFNDCTLDTCLTGATDCEYNDLPDGTACDNDLYCDGADSCSGGNCMPTDMTARPCDDGNTCTLDYCAEGATGPDCTYVPSTSFRTVTCGGRVTGTTSGSGDVASWGTCTGTLGAGPEEILMFQHDSVTNVTFSLVSESGIPTADYNELYLLTDGCDPSTCTQTDPTSITVSGHPADTPIYIAVESDVGGALWAVQANCS